MYLIWLKDIMSFLFEDACALFKGPQLIINSSPSWLSLKERSRARERE